MQFNSYMYQVQECSGHQGRIQSDPYRPQVLVPLINLPIHGQLQKGRDHSPTRSPVEFLSFSCWLYMKSRDMLTMCHVVIYYIIIAGCAYLHCLDRALVYSIVLTCSVLVRGNHCYSKLNFLMLIHPCKTLYTSHFKISP